MTQQRSAIGARKLIRQIVMSGTVEFLSHADEELAEDGCSQLDALNVLRGGIVDECEFENGEWRHRVRTQRMAVIVEIYESETTILVITAFKLGK